MTAELSQKAGTHRSRLTEQILAFRDERDWAQFHTPKNLAAALVVEASELLALFQWTAEAEIEAKCAEKRQEIEHEVADVYIYLLLLASALGIDLDEAAEKKMALNAEHYPVDRARGNARKYSEL
jgi:dCTP diphosphatase